MAIVLLALTLGLAFANGANDVSKGIATLVGSGVTRYRAAAAWGTAWTAAGAVAAAFAAQGLVSTFSGQGLLASTPPGPSFLLAVAAGAGAWVLVATRTGLPVSTTHALTGALCGAGVVTAGFGGVAWGSVARKVALPLLASPVLALLLMAALSPVAAWAFRRFSAYCVCVERHDLGSVSGAGASTGFASAAVLPALEVTAGASCPPETLARMGALDALHWLSAGATSFLRGLNDAPKILALGAGAGAALGLSSGGLYAGVAVAMGAGSLIGGLRVTRTLSEKVVRIAPDDGLAANLVTSTLVGLASRFALPVSTTHVSTGAILGVSLGSNRAAIDWGTVRGMLLAWLVTLPASALVAAVVCATLR